MLNVKAEKQHSQEQRAERARIFDEDFQQSKIMPNFLSEDLRMAYLNGLTADDFISLLKTINGLLTSDDLQPSDITDQVSHVEEHSPTDNGDQTQILPAPEDKEALLAYVLAVAQSTDDIEAKTMILGFGINAVHPFKDGNGRTSRLIYTLFAHDYVPNSPFVEKAVVDRVSTELVLAPSIFSRNINAFISEQMHSTVHVRGGIMQPTILVAAKDPAFNDIKEYHTPRRVTTFDEMHDMINIFADATIGPIVANLLDTKTTYRSVRNAIQGTDLGIKAFCADIFLTDASDTEVSAAYKFYREATSARTKLFIDILAGRQYADVLVAGRSNPNRVSSFQEFGKRAAKGAMLSA